MNIEWIKPSSPTPSHLRTYKISLLDQLLPIGHVPMILFFPSINLNNTIHAIAAKLKDSLSATLTYYHPFAGTIMNDLYVDCNDEGVQYIEALVKNFTLRSFLEKLEIHSLHKLVPHNPTSNETSKKGTCVVMVQVSIFECGGFAICLTISHKVVDGISLFSFFKAWAAMTSGSKIVEPSFIAPSLFPQNTSLPRDLTLFLWPIVFKQGKFVTRRFVFSASSIRQLKVKARSSLVKFPTKVEVVSAMIWRSIMFASRKRNGAPRPSVISHPVNLRRRKLLECVVGNFTWNATTQYRVADETEFQCLVGYLRVSMTKIDDKFIEEMQGNEGFSKVQQRLKELSDVYSDDNSDYVPCTSLCKVGFYDVDFGWGKPLWLCSTGGMSKDSPLFFNLIVLLDTRFGDGVEAWVNLDEQEMALMEQDPELLAFCCIDPSPCELNDLAFRPRL